MNEQLTEGRLAELRRFADQDLDQHESFTVDSDHAPVYVTISRQPDPDGRHYDRADGP